MMLRRLASNSCAKVCFSVPSVSEASSSRLQKFKALVCRMAIRAASRRAIMACPQDSAERCPVTRAETSAKMSTCSTSQPKKRISRKASSTTSDRSQRELVRLLGNSSNMTHPRCLGRSCHSRTANHNSFPSIQLQK